MTGSVRPPEMTADDVCGFLGLMDAHGIRVWLDGGWGVDACLGYQTRHDESIWKDLYPFHFPESREHKVICEQAINDPRSGGGCRD